MNRRPGRIVVILTADAEDTTNIAGAYGNAVQAAAQDCHRLTGKIANILVAQINNRLTQTFEAFKNKVVMDGITKKDVTVLENTDFVSVSKLAIQYSDGVIIANDNVNHDLKKHIETCGKPYLPFNGMENYIDEYAQFYEKILAQNV